MTHCSYTDDVGRDVNDTCIIKKHDEESFTPRCITTYLHITLTLMLYGQSTQSATARKNLLEMYGASPNWTGTRLIRSRRGMGDAVLEVLTEFDDFHLKPPCGATDTSFWADEGADPVDISD